MRRLKVYGLACSIAGHTQARCIVGAENQQVAAALLGVATSYLREYGSETATRKRSASP